MELTQLPPKNFVLARIRFEFLLQLKMNFAVSSKVPYELHLMSSNGGSRGRPRDHISRDPILIPPLVGSFPFIYNYSNNWLWLEVKLLHRNFNFRISEMPAPIKCHSSMIWVKKKFHSNKSAAQRQQLQHQQQISNDLSRGKIF